MAGCGVCPIGKETGKGEEALARQMEEVFLFPVAFGIEPLPFVKTIGDDETTVVDAVFEGWFFGEGFDTGIEGAGLDGFVFGPGWDKSPLSCFDVVGWQMMGVCGWVKALKLPGVNWMSFHPSGSMLKCLVISCFDLDSLVLKHIGVFLGKTSDEFERFKSLIV